MKIGSFHAGKLGVNHEKAMPKPAEQKFPEINSIKQRTQMMFAIKVEGQWLKRFLTNFFFGNFLCFALSMHVKWNRQFIFYLSIRIGSLYTFKKIDYCVFSERAFAYRHNRRCVIAWSRFHLK